MAVPYEVYKEIRREVDSDADPTLIGQRFHHFRYPELSIRDLDIAVLHALERYNDRHGRGNLFDNEFIGLKRGS